MRPLAVELLLLAEPQGKPCTLTHERQCRHVSGGLGGTWPLPGATTDIWVLVLALWGLGVLRCKAHEVADTHAPALGRARALPMLCVNTPSPCEPLHVVPACRLRPTRPSYRNCAGGDGLCWHTKLCVCPRSWRNIGRARPPIVFLHVLGLHALEPIAASFSSHPSHAR